MKKKKKERQVSNLKKLGRFVSLAGTWGNTDNYTGAKFRMHTPLIVGSYHLENPPCITLTT